MSSSRKRASKSSSQWRQRQDSDGFVRESQRLGLRSRSYFKIEELDKKYRLLKKGQTVVDLGASPGGWSQYVASRIGADGVVFAVDLLEMKPLQGVDFIQCDITQEESLNRLISVIGDRQVNLVLSDMAPNISGNSVIDSRNFSELQQAIFGVCKRLFSDGGSLVFKFFQDFESAELKKGCLTIFSSCELFKPKSSRSKSREVYMVARGFQKGTTQQYKNSK